MARVKGHLVCKNIRILNHRTSIRLEPELWDSLLEICNAEGQSVHDVCTAISIQCRNCNLTSAIRVFILSYFRMHSTFTPIPGYYAAGG